MDLQMPLMDGFEASRVLNEKMDKNEIERVPIVALSANFSDEDKEKSKRAGMIEHFEKPLLEPTLKQIIRTYIKKEKSRFHYDNSGRESV
jgi:CheY-like chemotaxis protein